MKKIYNVYHVYDVDGGFGDAVSKKKLLFTTSTKEAAEEFVTKYSNKHIYDIPYSKLYEGEFMIEEGSVISSFDEIPENIIKLGEDMKNAKPYEPGTLEDTLFDYDEE